VQTVLLSKAVGISLLVVLSVTSTSIEASDDQRLKDEDDLSVLGSDNASGSDHNQSLPTASIAVLVGIYLLRTWLMNCVAGLTKSVLNDYVSKKHRAKWNSLESINIFSWSGSAALGGWLVDTYGYQATFLVTAALQATAAMMLTPLLAMVPIEKFSNDGSSTTVVSDQKYKSLTVEASSPLHDGQVARADQDERVNISTIPLRSSRLEGGV
jgi:MFS family permease